MRNSRVCIILTWSCICLCAAPAAAVVDTLYPNLCPRACNLEAHANEYVAPNTVLFWYENGPANIGKGELRVNSGDLIDATHAPAIQRIKLSNSQAILDTIGTLVFDSSPSHNHWHLKDFVQYRLFKVAAGGGAGDTVIVNPKSGFCLTDNGGPHGAYQCGCGALEGTAGTSVFGTPSCFIAPPGLYMGISVGWNDLYGFGIEGQSMNITGLANGAYWLESTVNALGNVRETSTANNKQMIKVNIIASKDRYEGNNTKAAVDAKTLGATNSAYLSACEFPISIGNLNIDQTTNYFTFTPDKDWFKFRITATAGSGHFVKIAFDKNMGDLVLELFNAAESSLVIANADVGDSERVSLNGRVAGWYYVRIYGDVKPHWDNQAYFHDNWNYTLTINAPEEVCGDVNGDGVVSIVDILHFNANCFSNTLLCINLADVDGICPLNCVSDLLYLYHYVLQNPYPSPAPDCTCQ